MAKPTIRDIAAKAGVSPASVSNTLNGKGGVSPAVREQILSTAREMGYRSGREAARPAGHVRLIICRSHGSMVTDNPFFMEMIEGMQSECRKSGAELTISHLDIRMKGDFDDQLRAFREESCAGFILLATELKPEDLEAFHGFRSPLVALDNSFPRSPIHSVVMNNREAGMLAARELYDTGHRTFGYATSSIPFQNAEERGEGFREELARLGIQLSEDMYWRVSPVKGETEADMRRLIRERGKLPEALFTANDGMAISCMRAITAEGKRVPEDVSVIGMDDTNICEVCMPQLTTLHVYRREMGIRAARLLLSLDGDAEALPAIRMTVGVSLVRRNSVKKREK